MSDKSKKLEKQGPYIVIPKKGPYKKRRPWKKWSGGGYKAPKILKYKMGDKEYEFKKGGRVGFKSGTKRKTYTKGCGKVMSGKRKPVRYV